MSSHNLTNLAATEALATLLCRDLLVHKHEVPLDKVYTVDDLNDLHDFIEQCLSHYSTVTKINPKKP